MIHDGVRPFFSSQLLKRLREASTTSDAVIPALRTTDTLIAASNDNESEKTLDRTNIWRAQTPQLFKTALVREALNRARAKEKRFTDDASAVLEMCGVRAKIVEGEDWNIKITTPWDLQLAECLERTLLV
jgi:2-C-methyl-D-erythritol 4-phosphate cytidylyltransferase